MERDRAVFNGEREGGGRERMVYNAGGERGQDKGRERERASRRERKVFSG